MTLLVSPSWGANACTARQSLSGSHKVVCTRAITSFLAQTIREYVEYVWNTAEYGRNTGRCVL
jgi:hypothetical protein